MPSKPLTQEEWRDIAVVVSEASEGPWEFEDDYQRDSRNVCRCHGLPTGGFTIPGDGHGDGECEQFLVQDAAFISAARTDVPALVATLEAYHEALEDMVSTWESNWDCSRSPGHTAMNRAAYKARALVEEE